MARIDRSHTSPVIPTSTVEQVTSAPVANSSPVEAKVEDDFGSKRPTRMPSGRYATMVGIDAKLAEEFASLPAASRAGLLQVKSGGAGSQTKAFTPAGFAKGLEGSSREQVAEAFAGLDPKRQDTIKAALLKGTIKSPRLAMAILNGLPNADQQAFLKKLPKASLDGLTAALRAEAAPETLARVTVPVSIELAARTKWAEKNKGAMDALRAVHADMKLMGGEKAGLGSFRDGTLKYADKLLKSPEALASVLAHEGVHANQGASCCGGEGPTSPEGEAQGMMAGAQVWGELQPKGEDDRLSNENRAQLNKYTKLAKSGASAVLKEVTAQYLKRAEEKVAERKANPDNSWKEGDREADWAAYVTTYKKKLDTLNGK